MQFDDQFERIIRFGEQPFGLFVADGLHFERMALVEQRLQLLPFGLQVAACRNCFAFDIRQHRRRTDTGSAEWTFFAERLHEQFSSQTVLIRSQLSDDLRGRFDFFARRWSAFDIRLHIHHGRQRLRDPENPVLLIGGYGGQFGN